MNILIASSNQGVGQALSKELPGATGTSGSETNWADVSVDESAQGLVHELSKSCGRDRVLPELCRRRHPALILWPPPSDRHRFDRKLQGQS